MLYIIGHFINLHILILLRLESNLHFPQATLSVGWTTGYEQGLSYTKEMADEMIAVLKENSITQSITYPIRAAYVASSLDVLIDLVAAVNSLVGSLL